MDEKALLLGGNRLGPEGAFKIADLAKDHPALETIDLSKNAIGPHGARAFVEVIAKNRVLRELDLSGNGIDRDAASELIAALEGNRTLTKLVIGGLDRDLQKKLNGLLCRNANQAPPGRLKIEAPQAIEAPRAEPRKKRKLTDDERGFTDAELESCAKVIEALAIRRHVLDELPELKTTIARALRVARPLARPKSLRSIQRPATRTVTCYVCKISFTAPIESSGHLCRECAAVDRDKRNATADLSGRVALVTGGRIKIGRQIVLKLLRAGATVIATTRFPQDAAERYAAEPDYRTFEGRLRLQELDLLHLMTVETFAGQLANEERLDILINNAAQTLYRPPAFYAGLIDKPATVEDALSLVDPTDARLFPVDSDDGSGQPLDLRSHNSWRMLIHEVSTRELLTVNLVNAIAPYLLIARLRPLMVRTPGDKFVINVSAVEGQFDKHYKPIFHPHTNMAKAALNMLTRTSADDLARDNIYLNSVDPGWFSNQNPHPIAETMKEAGFTLPIDEIDAAARVLDPIFTRANGGSAIYGCFLKDYRPAPW